MTAEPSLRLRPVPVAPEASPARGFAADAAAHLRDRPRHCPRCGARLADGIVTEYWVASDRVFHCWCRGCSWAGDVILVHRMVGHESA